jgi:formylglycine-generating enzyme required for sulfatase activity
LSFLWGCCDCDKQGKVAEADQMVLISAGEFIMGTNKVDTEDTHKKIGAVKPLYLDQHPERKIFLDEYYIDRYEVTNKEYSYFLEMNQFTDIPAHWQEGIFPEGQGDHPVTQVTWWEAWSFCQWKGKQLPTEEQWEKAARGPDGLPFPWGEKFIKGKANVGIEGDRKTMPITSYPEDVSPYKVMGMSGNVMEWTLDWYLPYPGNTRKEYRFGKVLKVLRGNGFQKAGHYFLEAYRYSFSRTEANPNDFFENVGFRCSSKV